VKRLQEATDIGRYMLNAPGNGHRPSFIADPQIIPQKWGGNLLQNPTQVESTLRGITLPLKKGDIEPTWNMNMLYQKDRLQYPIDNSQITVEPRTINPAWEVRNVPTNRWDYLPVNPQTRVIVDLNCNIDTRNSVRDYYLYKV
jgi:hypothetical protein